MTQLYCTTVLCENVQRLSSAQRTRLQCGCCHRARQTSEFFNGKQPFILDIEYFCIVYLTLRITLADVIQKPEVLPVLASFH